MSTRVGMGVGKPSKDIRADSVVKKENAELKKANEKLAAESDELIEKLNEAHMYMEGADKKIAALKTENADLKAAVTLNKQ